MFARIQGDLGLTLRIGWFSPISPKTGIATYTRGVLDAMAEVFPRSEVDIIVFFPPTNDDHVDLSYPKIEITDSLLRSDFGALFDVAVYHLGNNELHHGPIYKALLSHPGLVVLHDHVYQHYLVSVGLDRSYATTRLNALIYSSGGADGFEFFSGSGFLSCDKGDVKYVPWESEWATVVPMSDKLARLGLGAVVHSKYGKIGLGSDFSGPTCTLFMPRPQVSAPQPASTKERKIHIVCAGHIQMTKGLQFLVGAFASELKLREYFKVSIVGYGTDRDYLRRLQQEIQNSSLHDVFSLKIDPAEEEYVSTLGEADLFYNLRFPNTEGASLSLSEQLSYGRPVIAYRTGSFAEMPEDSCYFLDRIGDVVELVDVLLEIGRDIEGVAARGERAWATVADKTSKRYAEDFVAFVKDNWETILRRQEIGQMRMNGKLPRCMPEDDVWFRYHIAARRMMMSYFDGTLTLPEGLLVSSDLDRGRFLSLGYFGSRVSSSRMEMLGNAFSNLTKLEAAELLGQLRVLYSETTEIVPRLYPDYLKVLVAANTDATIWKILSCLDSKLAFGMALEATAISVSKTQRENLAYDAERVGLGVVISDVLEERKSSLLDDGGFQQIIRMLKESTLEDYDHLPPLPMGQDALELASSKGLLNFLRSEGFSDIEATGIWTTSTDSYLIFRVADGKSANMVKGSIMVLLGGSAVDQTVDMTAVEIRTGRNETVRMNFTIGNNPQYWRLELPSFSGFIRLRINVADVRSPASLGLSDDQRCLGAMLQSLEICETSELT